MNINIFLHSSYDNIGIEYKYISEQYYTEFSFASIKIKLI